MSRQNHSTTNQVSFLINLIGIHILRQGPICLVLRARRTIPQIWTTLIWTGLIRHEMERGPSLNPRAQTLNKEKPIGPNKRVQSL
ncbi:hypothetical protein P3S67_000484 [Capsicum chacoense]